jgi:metallo-beta-lactamase class B
MAKMSALLAALLIAANPLHAATAEPPAAAAHVDKARALAGSEFAHSLFLCDPQGTLTIASVALKGSDHWLPPTWAFDDLGYVGNEFVGVWVLRTSAGLMLFDSGESTGEVQAHILPGLRELGLDPAAIRFVVITHGHWDHYGGAKTFTLYVTPGHTPGTLSALIPVTVGGKPHLLSLLGGTAFPRTISEAH